MKLEIINTTRVQGLNFNLINVKDLFKATFRYNNLLVYRR